MSRTKDVLKERLPCSRLECDLHKLCLDLEKELNERPALGESESKPAVQERVICKV